MGSLNETGRLRVIGRASAVHRGGFTIYPASIELRAAAAGIALLIVALPDERMGSHLTAVVEDPAGQAPRVWAERLRSQLPVHEHPNRVLVVQAFPLLSNGKPHQARLARAAAGARRITAGPTVSVPTGREANAARLSAHQSPIDRWTRAGRLIRQPHRKMTPGRA